MNKKKRIIAALGLLVLLISIPATLLVIRQRQQGGAGAFAVCPVPLDIMLVVDTSTTMSQFPQDAGVGAKKIDGAITAATNFVVNNLESETGNANRFNLDRVGVAYFNSSANVTQAITSDKTAVKTAIGNLKNSVAEGTRIHQGLKVALDELIAKKLPNRQMVIVLLTDGMLNPSIEEFKEACEGQYPVTDPSKCKPPFNERFLYPVADLAKAQGVRIVTIGFGKLEDQTPAVTDPAGMFRSVLEKVATTPSDFSYSPDNAGLAAIFSKIINIATECECNYESKVEVRDSTTDQVLTLDGFNLRSTVTGTNAKVTGPTEIALFENGKTSKQLWDVGQLPEDQKSTQNTYTLSTLKSGYEIVDTFCFETKIDIDKDPQLLDMGKGCPVTYANEPAKSHGPKSESIQNFNQTCDRAVTFGWRVKQSSTPPPTQIAVCQDGACIASTNPNDARTKCDNTDIGKSNVAKCLEKVCGNNNTTCDSVPIEDVGTSTVCTTVADCTRGTHQACVGTSCQSVAGAGRDTCGTTEDCQVSVCTAQETCTPKGFADIRIGSDILCDSANECKIRNVCWNQTCIPDRSPGEDECTGDEDCEITHKVCEDMACVPKAGEKEDQCDDDKDCYMMVCTENETCVKEEGDGADECQDANDCASPKHNECTAQNTCKPVDGLGADQCENNDDCAAPEHYACSAQETCELVSGFGADECTDDLHCKQPEHKECVGEACSLVEGAGQNQCNSNDDCKAPTHLACSTNETCITVTGAGQNQCTGDADCKTPQHKECVNTSCSLVTGPGRDLCESDANCALPTYRACVNETCSTLTGAPAAGVKVCTSDTDCKVATYKTCLNEACVVLSGTPAAGTQLCDTDAECIIPEPFKPDTGVDGEALAIAVGTVVLLLIGLKLIF